MNSFQIMIGESNLFSNYPYRGFDSETCFQKIRFLDLICKAENLKMLDLYRVEGLIHKSHKLNIHSIFVGHPLLCTDGAVNGITDNGINRLMGSNLSHLTNPKSPFPT
jgi:hypothetical protein